MPQLRESTRLERRRQIAGAAMRCFARGGISGTSMADIIRESGLSSGAIYSHFDSKADLLRHVMSNALEERFAVFDAQPEEAEPRTPEELLDRLLQGPSASRAQTSVLVQVWGEISKDAELAAVAEENIRRLRQLLIAALAPWAAGRADTEEGAAAAARQAAESLITISFGYAIRLALQPAVDPVLLHDDLRAVIRGLTADRQP